MARYRIVQAKNGNWRIQERAAFWWFDLHYGQNFHGDVIEFSTIEQAANSIDHYIAFTQSKRVKKTAIYYSEA